VSRRAFPLRAPGSRPGSRDHGRLAARFSGPTRGTRLVGREVELGVHVLHLGQRIAAGPVGKAVSGALPSSTPDDLQLSDDGRTPPTPDA
jgi:hypothetical protein